ncbi:sugar phosphate isomerase/epimerase [Nakamurella silvestris]|nr:sugar phosphate isomerase/epimerase [Nakamurella silvestris]
MCLDCTVTPTPTQAAALSRRRMLGVTAAGVAGAAALTTLGPFGGTANAATPASAATAHPHHDRRRRVPVENISIQLYTLRTQLEADLDGTLDKLARIGFRRVEHAGVPTGLTAKQFRNTLRSHGLRSTSGHNTPPSDPFDPVAWAQVLADANTIGQSTVNMSAVGFKGFDPVVGISGLDTAVDWRKLCVILNKAGKMAHQAGLGFGLHNHFWEFLPLKDSPLVGYDILIAETDPRYVHFEVDLFWAWFAHHDPAQLVTFLQNRITQFHVKDMKMLADGATGAVPVPGANSTFTDPGAGVIDFGRIFAAKSASPSSTEYIIERDDAGAGGLTTAKVGFNFLKNIRF